MNLRIRRRGRVTQKSDDDEPPVQIKLEEYLEVIHKQTAIIILVVAFNNEDEVDDDDER